MKYSIEWNDVDLDNRRTCDHPVVVDCISRRFNSLEIEENNLSCLELGAGEGFWTNVLSKKFKVLATDSSEVMLERNPYQRKELVSLPMLPYADNSFDAVFESNVLHHVEDDQKAVNEMIRVAKKYIIVVETNRNNPLTIILGLLQKHERKSLLFSKGYVKRLFKEKNVKLLRCFSHGCLPPNKCPVWFWRLFRFLDRRIPFFGLENVFIYEKVLR